MSNYLSLSPSMIDYHSIHSYTSHLHNSNSSSGISSINSNSNNSKTSNTTSQNGIYLNEYSTNLVSAFLPFKEVNIIFMFVC
ncbi:unnamed protein product [Brachionus calyciflorus]|uniref:Uncharacterized protein n=1 Tax=Brachionus calyciflorus TaxID=104777 RepID=A0A814H046_9BILA|nr:unnamed protein product [Brachionus calyciflorus]